MLTQNIPHFQSAGCNGLEGEFLLWIAQALFFLASDTGPQVARLFYICTIARNLIDRG